MFIVLNTIDYIIKLLGAKLHLEVVYLIVNNYK